MLPPILKKIWRCGNILVPINFSPPTTNGDFKMSLFSNANERIAQGLDYSHFCNLAQDALDKFRSGGAIGDRTVRLTKNGQGIATTRFSGTQGARVDQIAGARSAYLDAVERAFGLNARMKAAEMLEADGPGKPLTSR